MGDAHPGDISQPGRFPTIDLQDKIDCPFPVQISPDHEAARQHTLTWLTRFGLIADESGRRYADAIRSDLLTARVVPRLRGEKLSLYNDWVMFGTIDDWLQARDPALIEQVVTELVLIVRDGGLSSERPGAHPYAACLDDLWQRMSDTPDPWRRYLADAIAKWLESYLEEAQLRRDLKFPTLEDYLRLRTDSISMLAFIHIAEFLHDIYLPDRILTSPVLIALRRSLVDYSIWINDLASFAREHQRGDHINSILVIHEERGCTISEAAELVVELANAAIHDYRHLERTLPHVLTDLQANEGERAQVMLFASVLRSWFSGSLRWYDDTHRYSVAEFGTDIPGVAAVASGSGTTD